MTSPPSFAKLNSTNYSAWAGNIKAFCMTQGLWRIVSGASKRPTAITVSSPGGSNTSTTSPTEAELEAWDAKAEKARAKAAAKAPRQVEDNPTIVTWLLVTPKPEIRITNKKTGATKATKKPPIKLGPTTLSTSTTFDDFKVQIAAVARAPCDHLKLHTFKGYIEKKARKIEHEAPLMDGSQLAHMLTKAKNIEPKDRAIVELVICMDAPEKPKKHRSPYAPPLASAKRGV